MARSIYPRLIPGIGYHLYNRGNDGCKLFRGAWTYEKFFELFVYHCSPVVEILAYCLLSNHFHFYVKVRPEYALLSLKHSPSQYFANFFNAYTRTVNRPFGRTGALFERPFERIPVLTDAYARNLLVYIHRNAQHHGFVDDFRLWPYSSYATYLDDRPAIVARTEPTLLFGSRAALLTAHSKPIDDQLQTQWSLADWPDLAPVM